MEYRFPKTNDPYYPTPEELVDYKLELLALKDGEMLFDLGCGDARSLIKACTIAKVRCIGYEVLPEAIKDANNSIAKADLSDRIEIIEKDFFSADVSNADAVFLYFSRSVLGNLSFKLEKELRPGTRVVTHQFDIPGWAAEIEKEVLLQNGATEKLYLYRIT